jgi:hypothetical protein
MPDGVEVLTPRVFAANTVSLDPVRAQAAIAGIAARSGRKGPPLTPEEILSS